MDTRRTESCTAKWQIGSSSRSRHGTRWLAVLMVLPLLAWLAPPPAFAVDHVLLKRDDQELRVSGRLLVTAEDGGLLLMARDGALWAVQPEELLKHESDDAAFVPLDAAAAAEKLRDELGPGFDVYTTVHYVICYNTSRVYAQWCGALYERLYFAFTNFWTRKGFKLQDPEMPLVALVFADKASYRNYARKDLGDAVDAVVGYYSLQSNRVTMYDLTGVESLRQPGSSRSSTAQINQMLSQPAAEPMVATIIHEATHQIAFNCGLSSRYSDVPLWVSEGIAVYFETPDLSSSKGWRGIGSVNRSRLATFLKNAPSRNAGWLPGLLADDKRMRDVKTAANAYAEAWALNYYLIRRYPRQYVAYLKMLSEKSQLVWDDPQSRMAEFRKFFGEDLEGLEAEFVRGIEQLR